MVAKASQKMGFNATWSMAVGGMVGGGIFSVLGVVLQVAGSWAWLSFVLAGLIALATGRSYVTLAHRFGEGGGAFTFLREMDEEGLAGTLSWVLIGGYVLTISVYAFTFGHYLGAVTDLGPLFERAAAVGIVLALVGINLLGVGEASWLEIVTVWGKLAVLIALGAAGLWTFAPEQLHLTSAVPGGMLGALIGAATIFMAYEGFQLLTYDYEDIRDPRRTLPRAVLSAILVVIGLYVLVTLGATSLVGAARLVRYQEVALAEAGQALMGLPGKVAVSVAAAFSTASAINATLFATARLSRRVADDGELPRFLGHVNRHGIPDRAVLILGAGGIALAVMGNLGDLVECASLAFLFTFAVVNAIAARRCGKRAWISWIGTAGSTAAALTLLVKMAMGQPLALAALVALTAVAGAGRYATIQRRKTRDGVPQVGTPRTGSRDRWEGRTGERD